MRVSQNKDIIILSNYDFTSPDQLRKEKVAEFLTAAENNGEIFFDTKDLESFDYFEGLFKAVEAARPGFFAEKRRIIKFEVGFSDQFSTEAAKARAEKFSKFLIDNRIGVDIHLQFNDHIGGSVCRLGKDRTSDEFLASVERFEDYIKFCTEVSEILVPHTVLSEISDAELGKISIMIPEENCKSRVTNITNIVENIRHQPEFDLAGVVLGAADLKRLKSLTSTELNEGFTTAVRTHRNLAEIDLRGTTRTEAGEVTQAAPDLSVLQTLKIGHSDLLITQLDVVVGKDGRVLREEENFLLASEIPSDASPKTPFPSARNSGQTSHETSRQASRSELVSVGEDDKEPARKGIGKPSAKGGKPKEDCVVM